MPSILIRVTRSHSVLYFTIMLSSIGGTILVSVFAIGFWIAFLCVNEVREFFRVLNKKYRRVVAYQIPVAIFRIEFDGKTAWVTQRLW